ncbi:MAG: hypothetical protein HOP33_08650 [Verrucomicrobia bacterium]|nr:hypothetical protein [Verrucomicrobiota bacterium]
MSRRHKNCQYCGAELPESLLYTKAEIEALNREFTDAQEERKVREKAAEAEEIEKAEKEATQRGTIIGQMFRK